MKFHVVILSARASNLVPCVQSLFDNEPDLLPECIIVVDDGARFEAEPQLPGVRWVEGQKPFIFARNANIGIRAAGTDVILLNDDARLVTPRGFTHLAERVAGESDLGLCSAGIRGVVGNPNQRSRTGGGPIRAEPQTLAFICTYLRWVVHQGVGPLDDRFTGYGFEDNDYCRRVLAHGWKLGIWDGCVVDHAGDLPSSFRTRSDFDALHGQNRRLFEEKWATRTGLAHGSVDVLYLAWNRLEFTRETFTTLVVNTDWDYVRNLVVIDDGSTDGTCEWLTRHIALVPKPTRLLRTRFGSPVTAMVHFISQASAPILAKLDNDTMVPPGWLRQSLDVMDRHPELDLLGIEAMFPHVDDATVTRDYTAAEFISGIGLYRRSAFESSQPVGYAKWFGLEQWQVAQGPRLVRGWINPALPVFLLDRMPFSPWRDYAEGYVRRDIQRAWPKYDVSCTLWHWRWPQPASTQPAPLYPSSTRFLGALRVKNEETNIRDVLARMLELCQYIYVFDDHSTDGTIGVCQSFGERVVLFPSPFQDFDEARDKNYLLEKIIVANPEWVLWIDGDELLEETGPQRLRRVLARSRGVAAYSFRLAYVWDAPEQIRIDGIFGQFKRPSLFRLRGQPAHRLRFPRTRFGGNLHCGNVPSGLVGASQDLDVRLKHFGYMTRDQRQAKYRLYTQIDPNNDAEDNYRHLAEIPGARFAPGPPRVVPWIE